jgi:hypothetical protein
MAVLMQRAVSGLELGPSPLEPRFTMQSISPSDSGNIFTFRERTPIAPVQLEIAYCGVQTRQWAQNFAPWILITENKCAMSVWMTGMMKDNAQIEIPCPVTLDLAQ